MKTNVELIAMQTRHHELWSRLEELEIDHLGASFQFSVRLAKENDWTLGYARRVISEYERFLFLCVTTDHVGRPSDQVDQVWHMHLTYTHSYWETLCRDILGRPLHHEATRGGEEEHQKHVDLYRRTLNSYREYFGEDPPADIAQCGESIWRTSATPTTQSLAILGRASASMVDAGSAI